MKSLLMVSLFLGARWFLFSSVFAGAADQAGQERRLEKADFAGGCFWCMEHPFDELEGVISVMPGYTGGHKKNPTYEEVSSGVTGHAESVEVVYDPEKISYAKLLDVFCTISIQPRLIGNSATWGLNTARPFFITTRPRNDLLRNRKKPWKNPGRLKPKL